MRGGRDADSERAVAARPAAAGRRNAAPAREAALETARSRALEDRYTEVSSALRDASKALRDYENLSPGPHAETAAFIRQEIDSFARRASRDRDDTVDRIEMWLGVVNQWYTATLK